MKIKKTTRIAKISATAPSRNLKYSDLNRFLAQSQESVHEDGAISFFRSVFGKQFKLKQQARGADGYVPGLMIAELKGDQEDWLCGFFQSLAYLKWLDAKCVVVACHQFVGMWHVDDISLELIDAAKSSSVSPSETGPKLARRYRRLKHQLLESACWRLGSTSSPSEFKTEIDLFIKNVFQLEASGLERLRITSANFLAVLQAMKDFFDDPFAAVKAFYDSVNVWTNDSQFLDHPRKLNSGTLRSEKFAIDINGLKESKRQKFADFVSLYCMTEDVEQIRYFFANYDQALDAVAPNHRITNGIFFTDLMLARFAMWTVKENLGRNFGDKYLVLDPACGSGNLVSSWRSPLQMRHKVVSDIDPLHLHIVNKRLSLDPDPLQRGNFTVVPEASSGESLNFIDKSAKEYLQEIKKHLSLAGHTADRPLAILCNPPYRNDDDQTSDGATYDAHQSLIEITGTDCASDRLSMFLAQMKLICDSAESEDIPLESVLLLFTNSSWLTRRPMFRQLRKAVVQTFEPVSGFIVNSKEFFDVPGKWPLAFTIWRYSPNASRQADLPIPISDLTHLKRRDVYDLPWSVDGDSKRLDIACRAIFKSAKTVNFGSKHLSIKRWAGSSMVDFKRSRRRDEVGKSRVGGLPVGDDRLENKKAYGSELGTSIGFMDDLTPVRVETRDFPVNCAWSRLDMEFANGKRARLLSGRPDNRGYQHSSDPSRSLTWYAILKVFSRPETSYPLWTNQEEIWAPWAMSKESGPDELMQLVFALALAENECVETEFPADNPVKGAKRIFVHNPMSLEGSSFWSQSLKKHKCWKGKQNEAASLCLAAVRKVYETWSDRFGDNEQIAAEFQKPYFISEKPKLTKHCGLLQIRHFAETHQNEFLLKALAFLDESIRKLKSELFFWLTDVNKLDYFGRGAELAHLEFEKLRVEDEISKAEDEIKEKKSQTRRIPASVNSRRKGS